MAEEKKQKSTFVQLILFIIMSLAAFVVQFLIVQFGPAGLKLCGVDDAQKMDFWIFKGYTLAAFISFLVANTLAKIISYILNRKKTFNAVNNLVFSMTVYVIMCVTLIIVETIIGEPLAKAYANLFKNNAAIAEWAPTMSMITYSIADFIIVFLMEKFVIMNDNLFKKSKKDVAPVEEANAEEAEAQAEEVKDETEVKDQAIDEAPAVEEEIVAAPVEEKTEEPVKEEEPAEEKVEEAPVPEVAEEKAEEVKEEAPAEEPVKEEAPAEEPAKEEAKEEAAPVEEEKPAKKAAAKKAPAKKAAKKVEEPKAEEAPAEEPAKEEVKEEPKAEEPAKKAPAKKAPVAKAKNAGKIEFDLRVDGYHFEVSAINGQLMYESQGFASLDTAQSGFETFKKALETATATVYQDKRKLWRFVINKRYVGEGYKTRAQAEAAIESVKRDALLGTVCEFVEDPEEKAAFAAAKKSFNKGTGVDWDEVLKAPAKTFGKFEINGRADRGYYFSLFANNGQLLFCSRYYASEDSCVDAITTFKKACHLNNFFIDKDKFGNWRFVLKGAGAGVCYYGESYSTKDAAQSSSESVKKFAMTAKIVVAEDED